MGEEIRKEVQREGEMEMEEMQEWRGIKKQEKEEVVLVLCGIVQYNNNKKLLYLTNPFRFD